jgi:hypothetical protein
MNEWALMKVAKKHLVVAIAVAALIAAVVISSGSSPHRASAAGVFEPPIGLIIQVSSVPSTTALKSWLEAIRNGHRDPAKPGYVNDVILQDIADVNGKLLTAYLDVIAPYLPGGATPVFDHAYVGTVDLTYAPPSGGGRTPAGGSKYIEGIEDVAFRDLNVRLSVAAARAFKQRYPATRHDWYITYEANLSGFWDGRISSTYITYINQLTASLAAVARGSFMWSPAFWTPLRSEPGWTLDALKVNLGQFFAQVKPLPILSFQDFVGQSAGASTREDAAAWVNYLKRWPVDVRINAEQFVQSSHSIRAGDPGEIPGRESYYAHQGITLGPAFEARYWFARLYPVTKTTTPTATTKTTPAATTTATATRSGH